MLTGDQVQPVQLKQQSLFTEGKTLTYLRQTTAPIIPGSLQPLSKWGLQVRSGFVS